MGSIMKIIAIDLGNFNSMFCFYDPDTQEHSTFRGTTDRKYFASVLESQQPDLVVAEEGGCGHGEEDTHPRLGNAPR